MEVMGNHKKAQKQTLRALTLVLPRLFGENKRGLEAIMVHLFHSS